MGFKFKNNERKDYTGQRFGRLTAVEFYCTVNKTTYWSFDCECGYVDVVLSMGNVKTGNTKSCGCLAEEMRGKIDNKSKTHGLSKHYLYSTWNGMKQRCYNDKATAYEYYGKRGITVCERWLSEKGFENFLEDMGKRPIGRTIDRKDNDGNYEPSNCRWATDEEQRNNTSRSKKNKKVSNG